MTDRLIQHAGVRTLTIEASAGLTDQTRAVVDGDGFTFTQDPGGTPVSRPRLSLGGPRPAAGMLLRVAASTATRNDNDTATLLVYAGFPCAGEAVNKERSGGAVDERVGLLATVALTFGSKTEDIWLGRDAENGGAAVAVRWADTMALTMNQLGTALLDEAYGAAPKVFTPADNTVAALVLPQLPGMKSVVLDGSADANATLYVDPLKVG